jgi:acetyltransferase
MLAPASVAVIGDAGRADAPARQILNHLLAGGFGGPILPVTPALAAAAGVLAYPDVAALPLAPDLAVIAGDDDATAGTLADLAARGAGGAIVTGALPPGPLPLRTLGAFSYGLIAPALGLNASFCPRMPARGGIALVCQTGGFARAVLDHAASEGLGFSHVVSLGHNDDLGFTAVLDALSRDGATRTVLLEVGRIKDRRGFLSAARAVARNRAVIAVRSMPDAGPDDEAELPVGADLVFAAALRRAGIVDVAGLEEMLDAAATLSRPRRMQGERVLVVSAARSLGTLAARAVLAAGAHLATPDAAEATALSLLAPDPQEGPALVVPEHLPHRLAEIVAAADGMAGLADAVLAVHAPGPEGDPPDVTAEALAEAVSTRPTAAGRTLPVIAAWTGGAAAEAGRSRLVAAGLPAFPTIEAAARAIGILVRERRTREAARELPARTVLAIAPDRETVRRILARARRSGRATLTEDEAAAVLNAYGIPTAPSRVAADPESAAFAAEALGFPVVLKIRSPDLPHKTAVGGVVLDLDGADAVRRAAAAMDGRVARRAPAARREGFLVQRQVARRSGHELALRLVRDALFGPAIGFGQGGTAATLAADIAADLPPLNRTLAAALVARTRIGRLLAGWRDTPAADREAVYETLVRLSQLAVDFPDIAAVDVNPLVAGPAGVMALDAWIRIDPAPASGTGHLAIAPYPAERVRTVSLRDGTAVTLRPIRPEDADAHAAFFARLTPEDVRLRFFAPIKALTPEQIARMTQIDYDREMALIATRGEGQAAETLGIVRLIRVGDGTEAEFAIVVEARAKGTGLAAALMQAGLAWARENGITTVAGDVLAENAAMLAFVRRQGLAVTRSADDPDVMIARIDLAG